MYLPFEGLSKQRERAIVPDASQPWFEIQQRGREPALFLLAVLPVIDLRGPAFHARVDRLERVRRLQAHAEFREHAQAMECQRLVKAFVETRDSRRIKEHEFRPDLPQRALGGLVRRLFVRRLQLPAERAAMPLGQIATTFSRLCH